MQPDPPHGCTRRQALRLGVGGALLAVVGGAAAACSTDGDEPSPSVPSVLSVPSGAIDVTTFGAVGDGRTDDTVAVQRALNSLRKQQILLFPADRVFLHDDVLTVNTEGVTLMGPGELRATDERRSAVKILASNVTVRGLRLGIERTTQRWSTPDQHKLFVGGVTGVRVSDTVITGSAAAGLFAFGSSDFVFERVHVADTRADGIHLTYGTHSGTVDHPVVERSGDDGVAVVSYLQDGVVCHDVEVIAPVVTATTWGRGVSVVGGQDITYSDIRVERSSAAAVYLACEGDPSNTCDTRGVSVRGGTVVGANTNAEIDHGAVLVYSGRGGGNVIDVEVSGLSISDTRTGASRQIGVVANSAADGVSGVTFKDLRLEAGPDPYQGNAPLAAIRLDAVEAGGRAVTASVSS